MHIKEKLKRSGVKLPARVVRRNVISEILPWIDREEIIVLIGTRQTGKTVFENVIYLILKDIHESIPINYWRTKTGAEVDFILNKYINIIPVEVKTWILKKPQITRGFRSFLQTYKPGLGYYINRSINETIVVEDNTIHFITPERLFAEFAC